MAKMQRSSFFPLNATFAIVLACSIAVANGQPPLLRQHAAANNPPTSSATIAEHALPIEHRHLQQQHRRNLQFRWFSRAWVWLQSILSFNSNPPSWTPPPPSTTPPSPNLVWTPIATPTTLSPVEAPVLPPVTTRCGCNSCDDTAWNTDAFGSTCGDRINFLQNFQQTLYPTESDACRRVGDVEYPTQCRACDPTRCDGRTAPPLPAASCGCPSCTPAVWASIAGDNLSCRAHTTFLMLQEENLSEVAACEQVADVFPASLCGSLCDPRTCNANVVVGPTSFPTGAPTGSPMAEMVPVSPCGCGGCTLQVLEGMAIGNDGVRATCAARIDYVRDTMGASEFQACATVADEFPDVCGPCNSNVCGGPTTPTVGRPESTAPISSPSFVWEGVTDLGPNVQIFDPSMSTAAIQQAFDSVFYQQVNNEMGSERFAMYFQPGTYGSPSDPLSLQIGYYTDVAGIGASPQDVTVHGKIEVYNRCFAPDLYNEGQFIPTSAENGGVCFALNNFWRALSNLSINIVHPPGTDPCRNTAMFWAISQASSMRRVDVRGGDMSLMDYCTEPGFASGGFIADSKHAGGKIINGGQQQFFARNMAIQQWDGSVWNQVFLGVDGAPDDSLYPAEDYRYTTFDTTVLSREKPYLFVQATEYFVRVPSVQVNSRGVSWDSGLTAGVSYPLSAFFVARTTDSVASLNSALAEGKHLLFTPGVYDIDSSIVVDRADTVILGLGLATLKAIGGATPLKVLNVPGVVVSGLIFDAGSILSPTLLQVGETGSNTGGDETNPSTLHDVYFRVGGPHIGKAAINLEVNSNHVLVDHAWIWRADHGIENFNSANGFDGDNERWTENIGLNGAVINGDDVTATGLFVEHYQEYNLLWNGERGRVFFFQNELPYDPPEQSAWIASDGTEGWAGYKVSDSVQIHELWGGGVYCYNRNDPTINTESGFEVPDNDGIKMERIYTRNLSGPGTISSVINRAGTAVTALNVGPEYVPRYPV